jgi:putative Holliday junction resolvase
LENFLAVVMALDLGSKTIGVAVSDPSETFSFPGVTIQRQEGHRRDMAALREIIAERGVEEIVIGMPLMMNGSRGIQAEKIEAFIEVLKRFVALPIYTQDERLSTSEVERMLISADMKREKRKQIVDSLAASIILQSYLDQKKRQAAS